MCFFGMSASHTYAVMAGLVPAIHVLARGKKDVDARHKAGHDEVDTAVP
jgi:hypothetical protein